MNNSFVFKGLLDLSIKIGLVVLIIFFVILILKSMREKNLYLKQILEELKTLNTKSKH